MVFLNVCALPHHQPVHGLDALQSLRVAEVNLMVRLVTGARSHTNCQLIQLYLGEGLLGPSYASRASTQSEHEMRLVAPITARYVSYLLTGVSKITDSKTADIPPCSTIRISLGNLTLSAPMDHKIYMQRILHGGQSKLLVENRYADD
jgi:hypothetical protein